MSLKKYAAIKSAAKKREKLKIIPKHVVIITDCFKMRPILPYSPLALSWAISLDMVVLKPEQEMLHASIYTGIIS